MKSQSFKLLTCVFALMAQPALACDYYAPRLDLEAKFGSKRDIGEAALFAPVSCTPDRLLFTDIRFRADDASTREGNLGLGIRLMQEMGVAGGYVYFDRKKSGDTDKYYNQITAGAEWLAENWEARANTYIPLNGAKTIYSGSRVSSPYLAGSGIYYDRRDFSIIEKPLYGADVEAGAKIPQTNFWLYGGGYSFHADDVPSVTGARVRAKYELTKNVSLNAEGQYDDERGRQGWLGARLSIPFGRAAAPKMALAERMVASPIRDVDIVTQSKVNYKFYAPAAVMNAQSGDAQRVLYVDNTAAAGGDGSLERPYNTLSAAQGDLEANDVVYVFRGDGSSQGMDKGFLIDKDNVSFIGEGSDFVYDGGKFSTSMGVDYSGTVLRKAGDKPVITTDAISTNELTGAAIEVAAANSLVSGLKIVDAAGSAILVRTDGYDLGTATIDNILADGNGGASGIRFFILNADLERGVVTNSRVQNQTAGGGISFASRGGSNIKDVYVGDVEIENFVSNGLYFYAGQTARGDFGTIVVDGATIRGGNHGVILRPVWESVVDSFIGTNIDSQGNSGNGAYIHVSGTGNGGMLNDVRISHSIFANNAQGIRLLVGSGAIDSKMVVRISDTDIVESIRNGILFTDQSTSGTVVDVDISNGNRIIGNATSNPVTYSDVKLDLNGGSLTANGNWWGQQGGPVAGQITHQSTGTAIVDTWLDQDPRP